MLTISGPICQENEAEIGVHDNVSVTLSFSTYATSVSQCELSVAGEAPEDRNDMLCGFICLVDDHDTAVRDRAQQR